MKQREPVYVEFGRRAAEIRHPKSDIESPFSCSAINSKIGGCDPT